MGNRKEKREIRLANEELTKMFRKEISKISKQDEIKARSALICAVIQTIGFNPEVDYTISNEIKHKDLEPVPINLFDLPRNAIIISDKLKKELYSCPKYVYKVDDFEFVEQQRDKNSGRSLRRVLHIIGKTKDGYVPFTLIIRITTKPANKNYKQEIKTINTSFSALLKGKEFFILDRIDNNNNQPHHNRYYSGKQEMVFESGSKNRYIFGPHKHIYTEEGIIFTYDRCLKLAKNVNFNLLKSKIMKQIDAMPVKSQTLEEILKSYLVDANIKCFENIDNKTSLGSIFNRCFLAEKALFEEKKSNEEILQLTFKNIKNFESQKQFISSNRYNKSSLEQ